MKRAPKFLKRYFWNVDFSKLDVQAHGRAVLVRILEQGDERAVRWMKRNFTREDIADALFHLRSISPKSANYWALIYGLDRQRIPCLQKPYLEIRRKHWPY